MSEESNEVEEAITAERKAKCHLREVLDRRFPIGASVQWCPTTREDTVYFGKVISRSDRDGLLFVKGIRTGSTLWISTVYVSPQTDEDEEKAKHLTDERIEELMGDGSWLNTTGKHFADMFTTDATDDEDRLAREANTP